MPHVRAAAIVCAYLSRDSHEHMTMAQNPKTVTDLKFLCQRPQNSSLATCFLGCSTCLVGGNALLSTHPHLLHSAHAGHVTLVVFISILGEVVARLVVVFLDHLKRSPLCRVSHLDTACEDASVSGLFDGTEGRQRFWTAEEASLSGFSSHCPGKIGCEQPGTPLEGALAWMQGPSPTLAACL